MVYRVHKNSNYTTISNYHLNDKNLSFKAKGLLTFMLSASDDWVYFEKGFASCSTDGIDKIRSGLQELEEQGYLVRARERDDKGHLKNTIYEVFEIPHEQAENPKSNFPNYGKPNLENPNLGKHTLTNKQLNKELTKQKTNINKVCCLTPSLRDIKNYCEKNDYNIDCERFKAYYDAREWKDKSGRPFGSWEALVECWIRTEKNPKKCKISNPSFDIDELERALRENDDVL